MKASIVTPASVMPTPNIESIEVANVGSQPRHALHTAQAKGILSHGEHIEDLILIQAALPGSQFSDSFISTIRSIAGSDGSLIINEKFDGKPSIVVGFDSNSEPFVAYKGGLTRVKGGQLLFRSEEDVDKAFKSEDARVPLYKDLVRSIIPALKKARESIGPELEGFVFQGDLLFHNSGDSCQRGDAEVHIRPNTVNYKVSKDHALFSKVMNSDVGVAFHTVAKKEVVGERLEQAAYFDPALVEIFSDAVDGNGLFAIHPFQALSTSPTPSELIDRSLTVIEDTFSQLSDDFREKWAGGVLARFRVFLNSSLQPGTDGGLYSDVEEGKPLNVDRLSRKFKSWIRERVADAGSEEERVKGLKRDLRAFNSIIKEFKGDFESVLTAYYEAILLHRTLDKNSLKDVKSKLGGGEVEGLIFRDGDVVVKWVDRLQFTRKNNDNWRGDGSRWSDLATLPAPFEVWKPGLVVIPMKLQPPHIGHILMLRDAINKFGIDRVVILASDKVPNLAATNWKDLKLTDRKGSLQENRFTHPFSKELRRDLLEAGLGKDVQITMVAPSILRDYLRRAKESGAKGKIYLGLGEKERSTERYAGDLKSFKGLLGTKYLPLQSAGISGTMVRDAFIKAINDRDSSSRKALSDAFSYIEDQSLRDQFVDRAIREYQEASRVAQKMLAGMVKPKKIPAPRKRVVKKKD